MPKRVRQVAAGACLGLLIALLILRPPTSQAERPGERFLLPAPLPAPDAELVAHTGETVTLSELGEELTLVVFFGYTNCPDVCPLTMAALGSARELLGADAARLLGVLITVDPERDTPAQLASFLARFSPGLIGLTGPPEALAEAARGYLVTAARSAPVEAAPAEATHVEAPHVEAAHDEAAPGAHARADGPPPGYLMNHTGRAYVVQDGRIRMTFPPLTDAAQIAAGLKLLLDP